MAVGVNAPNAIEAAAKIVGYDKELRMKGVLDDIYGTLKETFDPAKKKMPQSIVMKIDERVTSESSEATITMQQTLNGGGVYGNDTAIGTEILPSHLSFVAYRNNLRKVVAKPGDGTKELDAKPYGMYERFIDQLADWNKAHEGMEIRQSLVERFGETLVHGDTAASCVRNWNPNVAVAGLGLSQMLVTPDADKAVFTNNIVAKVRSARSDSYTSTSAHTLSQPNLSNLSNLAKRLRITKLPIPGLPGGRGYILTISELQATYLSDPAYSSRNLGSLYKDVTQLNSKVMEWPGALGFWKDILFVVDDRAPTLLPSGVAEPFSLAPGYVEPTDDDQRDRDNPDALDVAILHGAACVVNWTARKLRHIRQDDDYGAIQGHGTSVIRGVQQPIYGGTTQFSSIMLLLGIPEYV